MKICKQCGVNKCTSKGNGLLRDICYSCHKKPYVKYKKVSCEFCGFIPVHMSQLDVDHKDGDKSNNNENNLQTLCANCHRLKTLLSSDYLGRARKLIDELQETLF